jgi:hypothetical protein
MRTEEDHARVLQRAFRFQWRHRLTARLVARYFADEQRKTKAPRALLKRLIAKIKQRPLHRRKDFTNHCNPDIFHVTVHYDASRPTRKDPELAYALRAVWADLDAICRVVLHHKEGFARVGNALIDCFYATLSELSLCYHRIRVHFFFFLFLYSRADSRTQTQMQLDARMLRSLERRLHSLLMQQTLLEREAQPSRLGPLLASTQADIHACRARLRSEGLPLPQQPGGDEQPLIIENWVLTPYQRPIDVERLVHMYAVDSRSIDRFGSTFQVLFKSREVARLYESDLSLRLQRGDHREEALQYLQSYARQLGVDHAPFTGEIQPQLDALAAKHPEALRRCIATALAPYDGDAIAYLRARPRLLPLLMRPQNKEDLWRMFFRCTVEAKRDEEGEALEWHALRIEGVRIVTLARWMAGYAFVAALGPVDEDTAFEYSIILRWGRRFSFETVRNWAKKVPLTATRSALMLPLLHIALLNGSQEIQQMLQRLADEWVEFMGSGGRQGPKTGQWACSLYTLRGMALVHLAAHGHAYVASRA